MILSLTTCTFSLVLIFTSLLYKKQNFHLAGRKLPSIHKKKVRTKGTPPKFKASTLTTTNLRVESVPQIELIAIQGAMVCVGGLGSSEALEWAPQSFSPYW